MTTPPPPPDDWSPDAAGFLDDLEAKPEALERLGSSPDVAAGIASIARNARRVLFLGMGSSRYASEVAALRLRAAGIDAVAEYAYARSLPPADPRTLVVGISASGKSKETVAAFDRYRGRSRCVAMTERPRAPLADGVDVVIPMLAGREAGGIACRTFQHTGLILRQLEAHLTDTRLDMAALCGRVAAASQDLLDRREDWLEPVAELLDSHDGVHVIGPAERWSAVAQSALAFREGPRRVATASETGDWNHVDVYLTKTTDYRALLLAGSPYDEDALAWVRSRGSTVVAVGADVPGADHVLTYRGSHDEAVALYTETLVSELVAWRYWQAQDNA